MKEMIAQNSHAVENSEWLDSRDGMFVLIDRYHKQVAQEDKGSAIGLARLKTAVEYLIRDIESDRVSHWKSWVRDTLGAGVYPASPRAFIAAFDLFPQPGKNKFDKMPWVWLDQAGKKGIDVLEKILKKEGLLGDSTQKDLFL